MERDLCNCCRLHCLFFFMRINLDYFRQFTATWRHNAFRHDAFRTHLSPFIATEVPTASINARRFSGEIIHGKVENRVIVCGQNCFSTQNSFVAIHWSLRALFPSKHARSKRITTNSSGDEIANVNFLYQDFTPRVHFSWKKLTTFFLKLRLLM